MDFTDSRGLGSVTHHRQGGNGGGVGLSAFPHQVNLGALRGLRDPQVRMPFSAVTSSFSCNAGEFGSKWQLGGNP